MKRFIMISLFAAGMFACSKDERLMYNDTNSVYFFTDSLLYTRDSMTYSFAVQSSTTITDTIAIPLKITGDAASKARTLQVVAVDSATTAVAGTHYTILPAQIGAGSYKDSLYVKVNLTEDLAASEVRLMLKIVPGGDLEPGAMEQTKYLVKINNILSKPDNWDNLLFLFFGTYSKAKHRFIIDVTGLATYQFFIPGTTRVDFQFYDYLKQVMREALREHGPVYDESGDPISFPS